MSVLHPGVPVMWYGHIRDLSPTAEGCMGGRMPNVTLLHWAQQPWWCKVVINVLANLHFTCNFDCESSFAPFSFFLPDPSLSRLVPSSSSLLLSLVLSARLVVV